MPDYLELLRGLMAALGPREAEAKMRPMDDRASRMIKLQREAQAPAPGTPEAEDPLTGRWFSPERRAVYQDIGRATEAHPKTVEIAAPEEWPGKYQGFGGLYFPRADLINIAPKEYRHEPPLLRDGRMQREEMALSLPLTAGRAREQSMPPGAMPAQDVLAHEQLHFLMEKLIEAEADERFARNQGRPVRKEARRTRNAEVQQSGAIPAYADTDRQHDLIAYLLGVANSPIMIREQTFPEPMSGTHAKAASPEIADAYRRLIYQIFPEGDRRERALTGLGAARGGVLLEELR